jgi:hypothetical protein
MDGAGAQRRPLREFVLSLILRLNKERRFSTAEL